MRTHGAVAFQMVFVVWLVLLFMLGLSNTAFLPGPVHYDSLHNRRRQAGRDGILHDIVRATESRSDFAGAALIRETIRVVQNWRR